MRFTHICSQNMSKHKKANKHNNNNDDIDDDDVDDDDEAEATEIAQWLTLIVSNVEELVLVFCTHMVAHNSL